MTDIDKLRSHNLQVYLKDGPRLSTKYRTWIEARDRKKNLVLIGGLGGMGVGQMWFPEEERHKNYPGYDDAPELEFREESWK